MPTTLGLQFSDLYNRVSRYLGTGYGPTGDPLTDAKDICNRAYRRFLYPVVQTRQNAIPRLHKWSFLKKSTTLTISSTTISKQITGITLNDGGTGYSINDILTIVQAGASGGTAIVRDVLAGVVTSVALQSVGVGTGYSIATALSTTVVPNVGVGCKVNITSVDSSSACVYPLPTDFGSITTPFTYTSEDSALVTTLTKIDEGSMLAKLSFRDTLGDPEFFCIRVISPATLTNYEVMFYPIPNGTFTFAYSYDISPPKLENASDIPMMDVEHAETLLQMCLAVAEEQEDGVSGVQNAKANELLVKSVQADLERFAADTIGYNGDNQASDLIKAPSGFKTGGFLIKGYNVY